MDEHLFDCESISAGSLYRMEVQADCEVDLVRAEELSNPVRYALGVPAALNMVR